jgi:hypothetical protein
VRYVFIITAVLLSLNLQAPRPAVAEGQQGTRWFSGSLGLETNLVHPDRPQDNSPMVVGNLKLNNAWEKFSIFFKGQYQTDNKFPFDKENKFNLGVEHPIYGGMVAYTYWERRYSLNADRYVVGVRYDFLSPRF